MGIPEIYMTVMLANFATGWFIYAIWRINKNERDWGAIFIALFILITVLVSALAVRERLQEQTQSQDSSAAR